MKYFYNYEESLDELKFNDFIIFFKEERKFIIPVFIRGSLEAYYITSEKRVLFYIETNYIYG